MPLDPLYWNQENRDLIKFATNIMLNCRNRQSAYGAIQNHIKGEQDDLIGGCLEITVGHGDGEALPHEVYGLGRNCNQWVITHRRITKKTRKGANNACT